MGKRKRSYLLAFVILVVACCCVWEINNFLPVVTMYYHHLVPANRCASYKPPVGFERDLTGTWEAGSPENSDTLVLRSDHEYKQSIHRVGNQYYSEMNYESDWQSWWIEYRANGIPCLHLSGMRLCGLDPRLSCATSGGNGYDFCSDEFVPMKNEGILLILMAQETTSPSSPQEINLSFPEGLEESWVYTRQKP
jgi:hypothetical protein